MDMQYVIESDRLSARFRFEPQRFFSERFEACGVVDQLWLDGRYQFCEPEQRIVPRITCHGVGLCGEYVWNELAEEAPPGEPFAKLGVGLLTQRPEGGPYDIFKHYQTEPFPVKAYIEPSRAVFVQQGRECRGVAARITKVVKARENELTAETTIENIGSRELTLAEYQHNFVSLNGVPFGPGCDLYVPFDGTVGQIDSMAYAQGSMERRVSGYQQAQGDHIRWLRSMDGYAYHKETLARDLHPERGGFWRLTRDGSPLAVEEHFDFEPCRLVEWGVEHCACVEVYAPLRVLPADACTWRRVWRFTDEND